MQHDKKSNQCQNKCTINNKNSFSHKIMIKEQFTVCSKSKSVQFVCAYVYQCTAIGKKLKILMKNVIKNQNKARNRAGNFKALKLVLSDP